ncbi:MAG: Chemotaxis protein CheW [Planctomycetota bacterium]|jgi:purine-binding chemotaxis protein CheW
MNASDPTLLRQAATFRVGGEWFGVDVLKVQEVLAALRRTAIPQAPPYVLGLINVRGSIVTAISVKNRLGFPEQGYAEDHLHIVMDGAQGLVSLVVDEIGDVLDIEPSAVAERPPTLTGPLRELVTGVLRREGGLVTLLDAERLIAP